VIHASRARPVAAERSEFGGIGICTIFEHPNLNTR
jgi:hypothetical protein